MAVALVFLMPFIWMVLPSLKPADEILGSEIHLFPTRFAAVENYTLALTKVPLLRYLWNGVLVCAGILVLQILVALPAAYAFAKLSFRGKPWAWRLVMLALMVRSEEHTSELQSHLNLVCRLLLEKKKPSQF